ncbi:MAG: DNA cytosine methyltransferase [Candidatus Brocadiia bacterium]
MAKPLTLVDLFAGIGGFTLGFLSAQEPEDNLAFDVRLLVDSDSTAAYTFKKNCPRVPYWQADLTEVDGTEIMDHAGIVPGELDFLVGGPPCQGFSPNGKRWLEDARNRLTARFVSMACELRPKCIILENVPTLLSAWGELLDQEVHEAFPGYDVAAEVLTASEFGVPQIRRRAIVVAVREDLGLRGFKFPSGSFDCVRQGSDVGDGVDGDVKYVSVQDAIGDLPSLEAGQGVDGDPYPSEPSSDYQRARRSGAVAVFNHMARAHSKEFLEKISVIQPGCGNSDLPKEERFSDNYYSQAYARLHPEGIAFTITGHFRNPGSGRFTHYRDNRSLTVREAARFQSFDDWFVLHGYLTDQERHVGNAIPPLMAEALARHFGGLLLTCYG